SCPLRGLGLPLSFHDRPRPGLEVAFGLDDCLLPRLDRPHRLRCGLLRLLDVCLEPRQRPLDLLERRRPLLERSLALGDPGLDSLDGLGPLLELELASRHFDVLGILGALLARRLRRPQGLALALLDLGQLRRERCLTLADLPLALFEEALTLCGQPSR